VVAERVEDAAESPPMTILDRHHLFGTGGNGSLAHTVRIIDNQKHSY
jgi:hypothetical protein